ncbi:uncharacterized protein LOC141903947 isoform X2 [Tubulanus polymorphus]|uniref:uncharacterized protein LOC141903947 isoform X2 n=1 Tax=Tubulanus polymorphus TaxID=672921 RepID=UPI003DA5F844
MAAISNEETPNLGFMTITQLKEECAKYKLPSDGQKTELIERIRKHLKSSDSNGEESEEEGEEEKEQLKTDELTEEDLREFVLDRCEDKKTITCKLCMESIEDSDEKALAAHMKGKVHKKMFEELKKTVKENGNILTEFFPNCETCNRPIPYSQWEYHHDTPRHRLNKLLIENDAEPQSLPFSLIQKDVDAINNVDDPAIGLNYVHEVIYAETYDKYKVTYICKCCNIRESDMKTGEQILKHIATKKHICNAAKRDHQDAYSAVIRCVDVFNRSRPPGSKQHTVNDELMHYIKDNPGIFMKRHRIKVKINLGDEYDNYIKQKYGKGFPRSKKPEEVDFVDPDVKAIIQDRINICRRAIVGSKYLIERQYLNGDVEYFCLLCHVELGGNEKPSIEHLCCPNHKKRYLQKCQPEIYKQIEKEDQYIPNATKKQLREREKTVTALSKKLAIAFIEKYPRSLVKVTLKAGKSLPAWKPPSKRPDKRNQRSAGNWVDDDSRRMYQQHHNYSYNRRSGPGMDYCGGYDYNSAGYSYQSPYDEYYHGTGGYCGYPGGYQQPGSYPRRNQQQQQQRVRSTYPGGRGFLADEYERQYAGCGAQGNDYRLQQHQQQQSPYHHANQASGSYNEELNMMEVAMIHKLSKVITKQVLDVRRGHQDDYSSSSGGGGGYNGGNRGGGGGGGGYNGRRGRNY